MPLKYRPKGTSSPDRTESAVEFTPPAEDRPVTESKSDAYPKSLERPTSAQRSIQPPVETDWHSHWSTPGFCARPPPVHTPTAGVFPSEM